eukprot:1180789-Prorocentrum_minimum.AAC.3
MNISIIAINKKQSFLPGTVGSCLLFGFLLDDWETGPRREVEQGNVRLKALVQQDIVLNNPIVSLPGHNEVPRCYRHKFVAGLPKPWALRCVQQIYYPLEHARHYCFYFSNAAAAVRQGKRTRCTTLAPRPLPLPQTETGTQRHVTPHPLNSTLTPLTSPSPLNITLTP